MPAASARKAGPQLADDCRGCWLARPSSRLHPRPSPLGDRSHAARRPSLTFQDVLGCLHAAEGGGAEDGGDVDTAVQQRFPWEESGGRGLCVTAASRGGGSDGRWPPDFHPSCTPPVSAPGVGGTHQCGEMAL